MELFNIYIVLFISLSFCEGAEYEAAGEEVKSKAEDSDNNTQCYNGNCTSARGQQWSDCTYGSEDQGAAEEEGARRTFQEVKVNKSGSRWTTFNDSEAKGGQESGQNKSGESKEGKRK